MEFDIIIPLRGFQLSKIKLRDQYPDDLVTEVVKKMFRITLQSMEQVVSSKIFVLTADRNFKDLHNVLFDQGNSLNLALEQASSSLNSENIFLVMPDFPGLDTIALLKFLELSKVHPYLISPSNDGGTALAILPADFFKKKLFGKNSAARILDYANERGIPLAQIYIRELKYDLDDIDDWNYWCEEKPELFK